MAEGWMPDIVRETQSLGQVFVEAERARDRAADLRDFQAVGQPDAEMIAVGRDEHLRLMAQPAKGDRMDDAVAVALIFVALPAIGPRFERVPAPPASRGIGSERSERHAGQMAWRVAIVEGPLAVSDAI